jgi:hypothetical protein
MKLDNLIKMICILPKNAFFAVTSEELLNKFFDTNSQDQTDRATRNTFIRRQIDAMEDLGMIEFRPIVKDKYVRVKRTETYFLKDGSLVQHFMNSKVALNVIWTNNVMKSFGSLLGLDDIHNTARSARLNAKEKALVEKVRLIPDGIGRKFATIKPDVLSAIVSAIEQNHMIMFRYFDRQCTVYDEIESGIGRTVLGLVAKDGTIYAITCFGYEDTPAHIPLHRIEKAEETVTRGYARPEFSIDDYVDSQHQLAHVLHDQENPITMVLKVEPEAMFHFTERAISSVYGEQEIENPKGRDRRCTVKITLPFTVQLPPFLWSHAGWVEVVSPPSLRKYVGERLLAAASLYQDDVKPRFD